MNMDLSSLRTNTHLSGPRLCLRSATASDADSLAQLLCEDRILRQDLGIPDTDHPTGRDVFEKHHQWEEKNLALTFVMVDVTRRAIGTISLSHVHQTERVARIGYWVGSAYRRQGYATEAFGLVLQWARELGLRSVSANIDNTNTPSLYLWRRFKAQEQEARPGRIHCTVHFDCG